MAGFRTLGLVGIAVCPWLLGACGGPSASPHNTLTAAERAAGWSLLFDGQSTDGWRGYNLDAFPSGGWRVEDGMLATGADESGSGADIVTAETFADFELTFEFRLSAMANSGVFYRVLEVTGQGLWTVAPEFQVLDDSAHLALGSMDMTTHLTGDNYDLHVSLARPALPIGEWNRGRILVRGAHVEHWLNDELMVTYELWSPAWEALVARSKFAPYREYGRARHGHIGLQHHDEHPLWYRNIKIREIAEGA